MNILLISGDHPRHLYFQSKLANLRDIDVTSIIFKREDFIKPKIFISTIICFIESIIILSIYSYYINDFSNLLSALIVTLALLIYNFNLSFYLTGLNPNENLMHSKIFLKFFILLIPILILVFTINLFTKKYTIYYYILFLIFSYIIGKLYFNLGIKKWEKENK